MTTHEPLAAAVLERRLITCHIAVANLLDLRPRPAQVAVGLADNELRSSVGDYAACQAVAAAAHQLRLAGIIAPAATGLGETLALFPANLALEDWPTVTGREIWRGLPAGPRRLRAVDDTAS